MCKLCGVNAPFREMRKNYILEKKKRSWNQINSPHQRCFPMRSWPAEKGCYQTRAPFPQKETAPACSSRSCRPWSPPRSPCSPSCTPSESASRRSDLVERGRSCPEAVSRFAWPPERGRRQEPRQASSLETRYQPSCLENQLGYSPRWATPPRLIFVNLDQLSLSVSPSLIHACRWSFAVLYNYDTGLVVYILLGQLSVSLFSLLT